MPSKVKLRLDNRPKGANVTIPGLGSFENGYTSKVDDRVFNRYLRNHPAAEALVRDGTLIISTKPLAEEQDDDEDVVEQVQEETEVEQRPDQPQDVEKES